MTRGRRVQQQQRPKCRDIMSYFTPPKKQPTASPSTASPPRKKQRLQPQPLHSSISNSSFPPRNPTSFYSSSVVSPSPILPFPTSISHPSSPHLPLTPPPAPPPTSSHLPPLTPLSVPLPPPSSHLPSLTSPPVLPPSSHLPPLTPLSVPPPPPSSHLPPLTPLSVPPPPPSLLPPLTSPPVPPPPPPSSHLPPLTLSSLLSPPPTPSLPTEFSIVDDVESLLLTRNIPFHQECGADEVKLFTRSQMCLVDSLLDQLDHMGLTRERLHRLVDYLHMSLGPTRMPPAHVMYRLWNMTSNLEVVVHRLGVDTVAKVSSLFHTMLSLHPPGCSLTAHHQYQQFVRHLGTDKEVFSAWLHIKQLLSAPYYKYFHRYISFLVDLLLTDFWSYITNAQTGNPMFVYVFWSTPNAASTMSLPIRQLLEIIHHMLVSYSGTEMELSVLQSCMALLFLITTRCQDITVELSLLTQKLSNKSFLLFISLLYPLRLHALMFAVHLTQTKPHPPPPLQLPHSPSSNLPKIDSLNITGEFLSPVKNCSSPLKGQNKSMSLKRKVTKRQRSQYYVPPAKRRLCENCDTGTVVCQRCQ